jgi:phenylacetate-CoA ligase
MHDVRSSVSGILWPAVPSPAGAAQLAMQYQLAQSERWPAEELRTWQFRQLDALLRHAVATVPFYAARFDGLLRDSPVTPEVYASLPLLTRAEAQSAGRSLDSAAPPPEHGALGTLQTSGSTGIPLVTHGNEVTLFFWAASLLREHLWHRRDLKGKLAVIRTEAQGGQFPNWGPAAGTAFETGPMSTLPLRVDTDQQLDWLVEQNPDCLLTFASNAQALLRRAQERGIRLPRLHEIRPFGETLPDGFREEAREVWGANVVDSYSAAELGYVALQCPDHPGHHYHVQAENLLVEILDEEGRACGPGKVGRVVVTTLHNFATPLIRYASGDYAMVGEPCPCGRTLPVLERIMGRVRNMLKMPDGTRRWASFPAKYYLPLAPIRQLQLVQHAREHVDVRAVAPRDFTPDEIAALKSAFAKTLGFPYDISITRVGRIERNAGGKFEEFLCLVPD